jgi:SAM-dependent methyltransferase
MNDAYIEEIAKFEKENFWFKVRRQYLKSIIKKSGAKIIDLGCGSGYTAVELTNQGYRVIGIDKSKLAVEKASFLGLEVIKMDLESDEALPRDFLPDYIIAMDFIEHINNPVAIFRKIAAISRADTKLIITVPAYQFLWSDWDRNLGHVKRYSPGQLKKELVEAGWRIEDIRYIHTILFFPAIFIRKLWYPIKNFITGKKNKEVAFLKLNSFFNNLILMLYKLEFLFYRMRIKVPFGLSILSVARLPN